MKQPGWPCLAPRISPAADTRGRGFCLAVPAGFLLGVGSRPLPALIAINAIHRSGLGGAAERKEIDERERGSKEEKIEEEDLAKKGVRGGRRNDPGDEEGKG